MLADMDELWDNTQYKEEYDIDKFLSTLKAKGASS